jgi:hypothetical protein
MNGTVNASSLRNDLKFKCCLFLVQKTCFWVHKMHQQHKNCRKSHGKQKSNLSCWPQLTCTAKALACKGLVFTKGGQCGSTRLWVWPSQFSAQRVAWAGAFRVIKTQWPTHPPLERNFGDHWMDVVTRNCKSWTWNRTATPCFDPQGLKHKCIEVWTMWRVTWSAHVCYTSDMCVSSHDCKDSDKNAAICFVPKGVSRNSTEHGVHVSKWNGNATLFSICACHPGTCE